MKSHKWMSYSVFLLFLAVGGLAAQSPAEIQQRMKERLPEIDSMKLRGAIGETNDGYVEARESLTSEQRKMIAEENADRKKLYEIAARRTSASLDEVEALRAKQIRERSPAGIWLQDIEGQWYRK